MEIDHFIHGRVFLKSRTTITKILTKKPKEFQLPSNMLKHLQFELRHNQKVLKLQLIDSIKTLEEGKSKSRNTKLKTQIFEICKYQIFISETMTRLTQTSTSLSSPQQFNSSKFGKILSKTKKRNFLPSDSMRSWLHLAKDKGKHKKRFKSIEMSCEDEKCLQMISNLLKISIQGRFYSLIELYRLLRNSTMML